MKYEGLRCDVCSAFEAHKVRIAVTADDKVIYDQTSDLCNGPKDCIERLLSLIARGRVKPAKRAKGGADGQK